MSLNGRLCCSLSAGRLVCVAYRSAGAPFRVSDHVGIRFGDTEATPEQDNQIAQVKPPPAPRLSAENPHPFELSDNPYFRGQVQALTQRVSNIEFASQEEKLRWLMREGAGLVVRLDFEKLYPVIWASQMELLGAANRTGGITRGHAIEHYAKIKELNPKVYDRYTYDQWIGFLTSSGLLAVSGDQFSTDRQGKIIYSVPRCRRVQLARSLPRSLNSREAERALFLSQLQTYEGSPMMRLLAAACCGSLLTLALASIASTPPRSIDCTQLDALDARLATVSAELDQIDRRINLGAEHLAAIDTAIHGEELWARNVDGVLDRIESNQLLEQLATATTSIVASYGIKPLLARPQTQIFS